jgi:hypothetical protein
MALGRSARLQFQKRINQATGVQLGPDTEGSWLRERHDVARYVRCDLRI